MKELPVRKLNRLRGFDYRNNCAYFVTVCTKGKKLLLWEEFSNVGGDAYIAPKKSYFYYGLSEIGMIADKYIKNIREVKKYVIMPNHIHLLIVLDNNGAMWASPPTVSTGNLSQIIRSMKVLVTKELGFSIWQRSFHDRIIRNANEYNAIMEYIDTNPEKWENDCFYVGSK